MSTTASGFSSTAAARPSARTKRPSASVLSTSTVFPPRWVITSDGRCALPDGMFSARQSHPVTLTGSSSAAAASTVCSTAAAPAMSSFIVTMPLAGLIDSPPESNVIPLPTIATERLARAGAQLSRTRRGGRTEPCPTATRPPYPPATSALSSSTVTLTLVPRAAVRAVERAVVLAHAVNGVRDLVNTAPVDLYPEAFAEIARTAARGTKVKVTVLDEKALAAGGYGGLVAVGQGSVRPPRLVRLSWAPARAKRSVAIVGKGITFDSGGLSIKPAKGMVTMKLDMAGAAAVLHTVLAAATLELPVKVTGWLCVAENMPSGSAQRPSDVITQRGGKTVEVLNTDAEGRLVLADGLAAAVEEKPDAVVDIATLTGAQMVALGSRVSAVMGTDTLREQVVAAATAAGEQFWPMPLPAELRSSLKSAVADLANIGDRNGGMLVAGLFLQEFVGDTPWAHLDIAGPAFNEGQGWGYTPTGGTGVGVRTLLTLLEG